VVGYALMAFFLTLPHLRWNDKPWMLLDLPRREFTFFGTTFLPTDTLLLMLLFLSVLTGIFLLTALFGRAWCGWGCPQTVYMEFVFRPIERLFEGGERLARMDAEQGKFHAARWLKHAIYARASRSCSRNTFLAYFVGTDALFRWMMQSPLEHPDAVPRDGRDDGWPSSSTSGTSASRPVSWPALRPLAVGAARQAVADRRVRLQPRRAARAMARRARASAIASTCNACVNTCPTGSTSAMGCRWSASTARSAWMPAMRIMEKVGKPTGLIRYSSQAALAGQAAAGVACAHRAVPAGLHALHRGLHLAGGEQGSPRTSRCSARLGAPYTVDATAA
jgi:hypothetical protein